MSGINTKASKVDRILVRQAEANEDIENIFALMRLNHQTDQATIQVLAATLKSKDEEINALRKYLGGALFVRRLTQMGLPTKSIPTLEPRWGNKLPHTTTEGL